VTLLLVILSVINIALGYGLAIYLGHARGGWAPAERATRSRPSVEQHQSETKWQDDADNSFAPSPISAAEAPLDPIAPEPAMVGPVNEAVSPVAKVDEVAAEVVDETPVSAVVETAEVSLEEGVLNSLEEARAVIHGQPAPATMVESLASEAPPESPVAAREEEPVASAAVTEDALLEGIGAFQAQLKKQQELAKLHAVTSKA